MFLLTVSDLSYLVLSYLEVMLINTGTLGSAGISSSTPLLDSLLSLKFRSQHSDNLTIMTEIFRAVGNGKVLSLELSGYPGYSWDPHKLSMGLPQISRVTLTGMLPWHALCHTKYSKCMDALWDHLQCPACWSIPRSTVIWHHSMPYTVPWFGW